MKVELTCIAGWASGSIDGRIAVEYFDHSPDAQSAKYAFRAHRQAVDGVEQVYPINALAYHPVYIPSLLSPALGGQADLLTATTHSRRAGRTASSRCGIT